MALSKKLRFEVFKRDSFTCQYCGRKAPDIVLECDHIHPKAEGGEDDILNLVTSCCDCNRGKGPRALSDDSAIEKKRRQLEELQERREQLDMMLEWQRSLINIDDEALTKVEEFWCDLAGWTGLNEKGQGDLRKLLRRYGADRVVQAMRDAVAYFEYGNDGLATSDSTNRGFMKIGGIIRMKETDKENPWIKEALYTRAIVRKRCSYCNERQCLELLKQAYELGVPTDESRPIALTARYWTGWVGDMEELIASYRDEGAVDG